MKTKFEIVISNFNRLDSFSKLVEWLKKAEGVEKITVVDNGSTYPPLLEYYETVKDITIIRGGLSWRHQVLGEYVGNLSGKFVITDSDLVPHEDCPFDLIPKLNYYLKKYEFIVKAGPKLVTNDIPSHYPLRDEVLHQQRKTVDSNRVDVLNRRDGKPDEVVGTKIATTFALYRNNYKFLRVTPCLGLLAPYVFRHVDWYENPDNFTEEYKYYLSTTNRTSTWSNLLKKVKNLENLVIRS